MQSITIDKEVLKKYKLSLEEFIVLLLGFYNCDYQTYADSLIKKGIVKKDLFKENSVVLSDNTKELVISILVESDYRVKHSDIDFDSLAEKIMAVYPDGCKAGTSYLWRGKKEDIARRLRVLVAVHNFTYTEQEALDAVREYVSNFEVPYEKMTLLRHFILRHGRNETIESMFMTIIENNRLDKEEE